MSQTEGSCLCGGVRFEITFPTRFCAHCHCGMCRRAHGAAFVTWVGVTGHQFRVSQGADLLKVYRSSESAQRTFCQRCGTTLLFEGDRWPNEVHVARACIEGDIDREPSAITYWDDRAHWYDASANVKKLGGKSGVEPISVRRRPAVLGGHSAFIGMRLGRHGCAVLRCRRAVVVRRCGGTVFRNR